MTNSKFNCTKRFYCFTFSVQHGCKMLWCVYNLTYSITVKIVEAKIYMIDKRNIMTDKQNMIAYDWQILNVYDWHIDLLHMTDKDTYYI